MKLVVPAKVLKAALSQVSAAIASKPIKPVYKCVLIRATEDAVTMSATDLELAARVRLHGSAAVGRPGAVAVSADSLAAIAAEADRESFTLETAEEGTLLVRLAGARYTLPTWPADEFPDMPTAENGFRFTIGAGDLRSLIRRTAFATDRSDGPRFVLTALLVETGKGVARLVATDSKRIAVAETAAGSPSSPEKGPHLLPAKGVSLVEKNLTDDAAAVAVTLRPNEAFFEWHGVTIHTRLVEGRFAPWEKIVPARPLKTVVELPKAAFAAAVRSAAIMTDADSKRVDFEFSPGKLTLRSRGAESGASEVGLALPEYAGEPFAVSFDPAYVTEYLRAAEGDALSFEFGGEGKPCLFRCGEGSRYVVMPLVG